MRETLPYINDWGAKSHNDKYHLILIGFLTRLLEA